MHTKLTGLLKLAQFLPSVGDVMNRVNADMTLSVQDKQNFVNSINRAGLTVNQPGSRIPYVVGGAIAGHSLAKYMGARPFWDGVYTLGASLYGNHLYNQQHPASQPIWAHPFGR